jgi:alkanesulfonate monooxygenase SsuD/methylene tetrahydromethanopterin reductase-like flavin-dependent oxidoreductase (luciferase family)/hemerythrin-like domain-containing protein
VDYGQELRFGLFPTPNAANLDHVLLLAEMAEVSGLDLVTVQDHPYQARHVDAWTLLAVIAARSSSLRVALNVANLPLRPPVVLAKSIATLDRVTGGRVDLGLGAGAFWDAIVAAGGTRLTPAESVGALREAIEVVRGVWRDGGPSVRIDGDHYRVAGLHPGPAPAHPVEIWLGAYKRRMLRLTGRYADGWLPSMGYADSDALAGMNHVIDEAARAAGRDPAAVRRLYNVSGSFQPRGGRGISGTEEDWADQLAALVLDLGMSTFILGTDDVEDLRRFGEEVAPRVRDLVDAARRSASAPAPDSSSTTEAVVTTSAPAPEPNSRLDVNPTPDDGTRFSDRAAWDESTRPTYPVPATFHYTAVQQAAPQHLIDVHDALRTELARLRNIVEQVADGRTPVGSARSAINRMTLRQNNWTLGAYCEQYCRIVSGHHTLEDVSVFPHLRRVDGAAPVLDRLAEEHDVIAELIDHLDSALVAMVADEDAGTEKLQEVLDLVTDALLSHLSYEERELLHPLAQAGFQ